MAQQIAHAAESVQLADLLERILDKGLVVAADVRINLLDIELLTINIRLLLASVERAREMGIDWWEHSPFLSERHRQNALTQALEQKDAQIDELNRRLARLEQPQTSRRKKR